MLERNLISRSTHLASLDYQSQLDSTNDQARRRIGLGDLPLPALILTDSQTAGRGQPGRSWWSSADSLTFSWCFQRVSEDAGQPPRLPAGMIPLAAADALCAAIGNLATTPKPRIKWPNDVLLDGHKIAGILVESTPTSTGTAVIVGIGINVNQGDVPDLGSAAPIRNEPWPPPSSLRLQTGRSWSRTQLLIHVVNELDQRLLQHSWTAAEVARRCDEKLFLKGRKIAVAEPNNRVTAGILLGLAADGGLQVETEHGVQTLHRGSMVSCDTPPSGPEKRTL